jgi:hypothetical protein
MRVTSILFAALVFGLFSCSGEDPIPVDTYFQGKSIYLSSDIDGKHQIYRWAFANISQSFNNSTNDIDTSIAFRLKTFIYFIKEQNFTSDMTIYDHLMYAYDSNNRISIVHN